jgi:hypothetical protein
LKAGVRRRSNEQTLVAMLKVMQRKAATKCAQTDTALSKRLTTNAEGRNFTALYSDTVGILETCMTVKPPSRRHTIAGEAIYREFGSFCE